MSPSSEEEDNVIQDNYYTFLNVSKDASQEEITNAYRRLSKLYHPDKHADPSKKRDAEILFNKTRKAYEILSDPHKRAIYDTLGTKGLEAEGWEIVQRTKTPQEIREEFERLAREEEERRLQQRTNPRGTITVGVNATDLFEIYEDYEDSRLFPNLEVHTMSISQSIEAPLNTSDTVTLSGSLTTQNGTGSGGVVCSLRHVVSAKTWTEVELGAGNGPVFSVKGFRTISKRSFGTLQGIFYFMPMGVRPGLVAVLGRQLDKHTTGYLTWKAGIQSSMNSMIVWDTEKSHLVAAIQFGIPSTYVTLSYTHKFPNDSKAKGSVKIGTVGALVEYGCETRISQHSIVGASMAVGVPSGVVLKLRLTRANQNYIFPILLTEELMPSAIFYGTVAPVIAFYAVKAFVIDPYRERQKKKEAEKKMEANAVRLAEKMKEAVAAVSLMQETYHRIVESEQAKAGLIITVAQYGNREKVQSTIGQDSRPGDVIEVTIPLQCLVKDSALVLPAASKSDLPGFFDPCNEKETALFVQYKYRDVMHEVVIADDEPLRLPKEVHKIQS